MAKKLKDYYNLEFLESLIEKIETGIESNKIDLQFDSKSFMSYAWPEINYLEFLARQDLVALDCWGEAQISIKVFQIINFKIVICGHPKYFMNH